MTPHQRSDLDREIRLEKYRWRRLNVRQSERQKYFLMFIVVVLGFAVLLLLVNNFHSWITQ